jgi:hypothetical protein
VGPDDAKLAQSPIEGKGQGSQLQGWQYFHFFHLGGLVESSCLKGFAWPVCSFLVRTFS